MKITKKIKLKGKETRKINLDFRKFFASFLIVFLILNMLLYAMNYLNEILFWINLGVISILSFKFYK